MSRQSSFSFHRIFTVLVLLCLCFFLVWYVPSSSLLAFSIRDVQVSLDTSRQREVKQQYEYDQVISELPVARDELSRLQPLADSARAEVTELKSRRKELRARKQELLDLLSDEAKGEQP